MFCVQQWESQTGYLPVYSAILCKSSIRCSWLQFNGDASDCKFQNLEQKESAGGTIAVSLKAKGWLTVQHFAFGSILIPVNAIFCILF